MLLESQTFSTSELAWLSELENRTFSTSEVARHCETDRQTVLAWDRRGVLSPPKVAGERVYALRDLTAALTIPGTRALALPPEAVNRIVEIVREADPVKLKLAMLVTYRSETPGMMRHAFIDSDDESEEAREWVRNALHEDEEKSFKAREIISHATLEEIVHAILRQIAKKLGASSSGARG